MFLRHSSIVSNSMIKESAIDRRYINQSATKYYSLPGLRDIDNDNNLISFIQDDLQKQNIFYSLETIKSVLRCRRSYPPIRFNPSTGMNY